MPNQKGPYMYDRTELLKRKAAAEKLLKTSKTISKEQRQQLLNLIRAIDAKLISFPDKTTEQYRMPAKEPTLTRLITNSEKGESGNIDIRTREKLPRRIKIGANPGLLIGAVMAIAIICIIAILKINISPEEKEQSNHVITSLTI